MPRTGFYTDERTFWHATGMQSLFLPVGGWVQPPNGTAGADTPDSKRRLLNLATASGLTRKLRCRKRFPPRSRMSAASIRAATSTNSSG
jgi:hypothetical protein